VLQRNYLAKVTHSPDYCKMPLEDALADLTLRVRNYERVYEPLDEGPVREDVSYIKLINLASKCVCNRIHGTLMHAIASISFLMSIHVQPRPIYLSRAGRCVGAADESNGNTAAASSSSSAASPTASFADGSLPASSSCAPLSSPSPLGPVPGSAASPSKAAPDSSPLASADPVLVTYTQSEAASLDATGQKYARLMNAFEEEQVLQYWHTHLVSKRAENPSASNTIDPADNEERKELSPNELAAATVFSPPVSSPSSPVLSSTRGPGLPDPDPEQVSTDREGTELPERLAAATVFSPPVSSPSSPVL
jgi:hypothetical protein